ncbi:hypothetical protein NQ314_007769 [Rhamnusium bicolor]|uniref:Uncharacterized protein n=1 Tax=Rhamnusium bicolor TaxID=1586634 RepID=A0AAV8YJJ7_9CUCU|nr:hypothetical protein NQ314_007769 [Rhamnusium bicolor]
MTYVNKKTRIFLDRGDLKPERRRSESRLKIYPSAIDVRAWCDIVEDRRQHILELVTKGAEKCAGKLIPLEAIIDALPGSKTGDSSQLKKCMAELWKFIQTLSLSKSEQEKLGILNESVAKSLHDKEREEVEALTKIDREDALGTYTVITEGPARITTRIKGIQPGFQIGPGKTAGTITTRAQGSSRAKATIKNAYPETNEAKFNVEEAATSKALPPGIVQKYEVSAAKQEQISTVDKPLAKVTSKALPPGIVQKYEVSAAKQEQISTIDEPLAKVMIENKIIASQEPPTKFNREEISSEMPIISKQQEEAISASEEPTMKVDKMDTIETILPLRKLEEGIISAGREPLATIEELPIITTGAVVQQEQPFTESSSATYVKKTAYTTEIPLTGEISMDTCNAIRDQLAQQNLIIEKLKIQRDDLQNKLDNCLEELENAKKSDAIDTPLISSACKEEIDALELEITEMRSGSLSPEQEADVIKKEVEVLKKILHETKLKNKVVVSGIEVGSKENIPDMEELNSKLNNLEDLTRERDSLANRVQKLEKELLQYRDLPEDVDVYRNRSKMLDSALEERDKMGKKIEQIKDLENELNELRKKAARVDELEQELIYYSKSDRAAGIELSKTKSRCGCLERELQNVRMERDSMAKRIECLKREVDNLKSKSKEAEILKLERDRLQIKLNELSHMQVQHENLRLKCKCLESAANERDMYKHKYDEIVSMECQCEMLRSQVDAAREMTRERDSLMKQLKKKDCLIAASEEKLTAVQAQLKSSIQGVSCETTCLKTRIDELERELDKAQSEIEHLQVQVRNTDDSLQGTKKLTKSEFESVAAMKRELEAAKEENKKLQQIANKMVALTGDEHVQKMLKQSECAVKRVVEELGKQYKQWDHIKYNTKRASAGDANKIRRFESKDVSDSESNEKLKEELEDILREKEKLETLVKQIQSDKFSCRSQEELISLRIENAHLQEELQKEIKCRKDLEKNLNK